MCYNLNSVEGDVQGVIQESTIEVIKGDTRSVDYGSRVMLRSV